MKKTIRQCIAICLISILALSAAGCEKTTAGRGTETPAVIDGALSFSAAGGLYAESFDLILSTDIKNSVIRYTLDGSDPTSESTQYIDKITIEDRTGEDNLLSAIVASGGGDFGGGTMTERNDGDREMEELPEGGFQAGDLPEGTSPNGDMTPPEDGLSDDDMTPPEAIEDSGTDITAEDTPDRADMSNNNLGGGRGGSNTAPEENVFKGTVVKAAVFSESGEILTDISVESYFVSEDIFTQYGDLPIVSIVTDADNFYDDETGIYVNYEESGSDWERPVYFEMFEADGTSVISQNMGVRINGGTTRSLAQKALRFYAKSSYDEENPTIEYELFEGLTTSYSDDILTTFKRVILRSSGNDNSGTLFRDALMQELVSDLNVDTQASRPCVAFVNGEFWGIYNIRERYDDHYFANHYDIDTDNVAVLEISSGSSTPEINEGDESDLAFYNEMIAFFNSNSMTDEVSYLKAQEYIDMDNLIDYYITNIYSGNTDWPANNNEFWRYKTDNGGYDDTAEWYMDGRFRWIVKDMDWGFGLMGQTSSDTLAHAMNESSSGEGGRGGGNSGFTSAESTLMFRKLLENEEFLEKFINRFCDVMNTNYDTDTVVALINEMKTAIEPAIEEQSNRYPSSVSSVSSWESNVEKMIQFAQERTGYVQGFLQSRFSLSDIVTVTLNTDSGAGYIRINDTDITVDTRGISDASSWNGSYFGGTTQTFAAVALNGHTFVKFVVTDTASGTAAEYTDSTIEVALGSGGTVVQAIFE